MLMLWHARRQVDNIFQLVRINDRVQIKLAQKSYFTRVEDVQQGELYLAAPIERGNVVTLGPGVALTINVFVGLGVRQFEGKVKHTIPGEVSLVVIHHFKAQGAVQNRNYERLGEELHIRYRREDGPDNAAPWRPAVTRDVSGGGMQVIAKDAWLLKCGDLIEIELMLPGEALLHAICQAVRISDVPGCSKKYQLGLNYIDLDESDRARLVKYIHNRLDELRKSGSTFVRCDDCVTVSYRKSCKKDESWTPAKVKDMSADGLRMVVQNASGLLIGLQLDLMITLMCTTQIGIQSEVIWTRPALEQSCGYEIGIKFLSLDNDARDVLLSFLSHIKYGVKGH
jgi:c-di-GMP-binding flagellar brake protein YcgR